MPRRLRNWTYNNVTDFLKENGFRFHKELGGSHQSWGKFGDGEEPERTVELNFTRHTYPVKTLEQFIKESGIPKPEWTKWAGS